MSRISAWNVLVPAILVTLAVAAEVVPSAPAADDICDADNGTCASGGHACADDHDDCPAWRDLGECDRNPGYMLKSCRWSCQVCDGAAPSADCREFGVPQRVHDATVRAILDRSATYVRRLRRDPVYAAVRRECRNRHEDCSRWALGDGCDENPLYMKMECAPACQSCDYILKMKEECALDPEGEDALVAGGMDALFERMVRVAAASDWQPTVLSRPRKERPSPDMAAAPALSCDEDKANPCDVRDGPWILTLDDFVSEEEVAVIMKIADGIGYERSLAGDEVLEARTSSQAWCMDGCMDDPVVAALTGIPEEHYENLQLLRYEPGQYYQPHTDWIDNHVDQSHGPRLLTVFVYFNEVTRGGATRFPSEGLSVRPRRGRVLIWPSARDDDD